MNSQDDGATNRPFRRALISAAKLAAFFAAFALLTHISWNLFAPDLFGLPQIQMKQALGLVTFAGILNALLRSPIGRQRHG